MPTYDYLCENCKHQFEAFQSITAEPLNNCPECGGAVKRLIGGGNGLIFKGSGFYITDYKNGSGAKTETKASTEKAETKSSSETSKKD